MLTADDRVAIAMIGATPTACPQPVKADIRPSERDSRFGTWQNGAHAVACPQLAEADMRAFGGDSGFDPVQTSGVQCNRLSGCGMVSLPVDLREMGILQSF
jgi:hypothetical protein